MDTATKMIIENLKETRVKAGFFTQKEFAEYYNLNLNTVKSWESGRTLPAKWVYKALADKIEKEHYKKQIETLQKEKSAI